jgi:hypothetical protein
VCFLTTQYVNKADITNKKNAVVIHNGKKKPRNPELEILHDERHKTCFAKILNENEEESTKSLKIARSLSELKYNPSQNYTIKEA